jgi:hypothetical protein
MTGDKLGQVNPVYGSAIGVKSGGLLTTGTTNGQRYEEWMKFFHWQPTFDDLVAIRKRIVDMQRQVTRVEEYDTAGLPEAEYVARDLEVYQLNERLMQMHRAYHTAIEVMHMNPDAFRAWRWRNGIEARERPEDQDSVNYNTMKDKVNPVKGPGEYIDKQAFDNSQRSVKVDVEQRDGGQPIHQPSFSAGYKQAIEDTTKKVRAAAEASRAKNSAG